MIPKNSGLIIKQTFYWTALAVLVLLLASCNDESPSPLEEASPKPPIGADGASIEGTAVPTTAPAEATAVPSALEAAPANPPPLPVENSSLQALNLVQRWRHDTTSPVSLMDFVSLDGLPFPDIVAVTEDGQVITLSINDRSYWEASLPKPALALAAGQAYGGVNGDVAVSIEETGIQLLELSDVREEEEMLWQYEAPSNVTALTFMDAAAGTPGAGLLAGTENGLFLVLDAGVEPQLTASLQLDDTAVKFIEMVAVDAGSRTMAVVTEVGLLSLVSERGELVWQEDLLAHVSQLLTSDLNDTGQREIIVGTTSGEVIAFDQAGDESWRWHIGHPIEALALARLGNTPHIIVGSDGQIAALSPVGSITWQYQLSDSLVKAIDSGDVDRDGQEEIFIGSAAGEIFILDENGRIRGEADLENPFTGMQLENIDGETLQPELVVWAGPSITLFDAVVGEDIAAGEPANIATNEIALDEEAQVDLPHYDMEVVLDVAAHHGQVRQKSSIKNTSDEPWDELVFHVSPAYWSGIFNLINASVQLEDVTSEVTSTLDITVLRVPLPQPLEPGKDVRVTLDYELFLPKLDPYGWGPIGNAGWGPGVIQMGDWYPALVPYRSGSGWQTWQFKPVGDPVISRLANYDVAINPLSEVTIAAPGFQQNMEDGSSHYRLEGARAFSFLASNDYVRQDGSSNGVPITVYTSSRYQDAGQVVMDTAKDAIVLFSELYGPYPYQELIIAENGFLTAMEYSGLVSLSGFAFDSYDGTASSLLVPITAHEVAHQWWYGAVGNDQVNEPWLDEAMAMFSELLFYERHYPDLTDWWWQFRVDRWNPIGYVDDTIYDYPDSESFIHNMYGPAAHFMFDLRSLMGAVPFRQFLLDYSISNRDSFVSRDDFFAAVQSHTDAEITSLIDRYFKSNGS